MSQRPSQVLADHPDYIGREVRGDLTRSDRPLETDGDKEERQDADHDLLEQERDYISGWLTQTGTNSENQAGNLTGLALSGGGIRSATFSLGVLQALAKHRVLERIDYISTVSGGGYIGAGLLWWLSGKTGSKQPYGLDADSFPYGVADPAHAAGAPPSQLLTHLRENANYLVPGNGINYLSGAAIVIRAVLLNLFVWIFIAAGLFALLFCSWPTVAALIPNPLEGILQTPLPLEDAHFAVSYGGFYFLIWFGAAFVALFAIACIDFAFFTHFTDRLDDTKNYPQNRTAGDRLGDKNSFNLVTRLLGSALVFLVGVALLYVFAEFLHHWLEISKHKPSWPFPLGEPAPRGPTARTLLFLAIGFAVAAPIAALVIAYCIRRLWRVRDLGFVYGMRRFFERLYGNILLIGFVLIALGSIPSLVATISSAAATNAFGVAGIVLGVASGVWGYFRSVSTKLGSLGPQVLLSLGSILLFFGIALTSYQLATFWLEAYGWTWIGLTAVFLIAMLSGFANINEISPHMFYRDRLMEAFLPDVERVEDNSSGSARRAERFMFSEAWRRDAPSGPYPIVNTNVILVNSSVPQYRSRGGDSFALTPMYCGSGATGWIKTVKFCAGTLTLPTAMAISGAAANPNTGVGGKGLTRNRFVSAVMTLFNLRLGLWVRRPTDQKIRVDLPNHFHPSLTYSVPSFGYKEDSSFLALSDGGHFENLGIYELVRRGCRLIIVSDGGQDIQASYSDFVTAIRRIEQDFGAEIDFPNGGPERMIARPRPGQYPKDADYADFGYLWGKIIYHRAKTRGGPAEGIIIYLKTTMIPELSIKAKGYKGAEPDFPDQSTGDQFFDEEQFEAYRELGYRISDIMCEDPKLNLKEKLQSIKPDFQPTGQGA